MTALIVAAGQGLGPRVAKGTFTVQPFVGGTVSTVADMQSYDLGGRRNETR